MIFTVHSLKKAVLSVAALLSASLLFAQSGITGRVLDETGSPMVGAHVAVKGTTVATATDLDGRFSLNIKGNNAIIEVTFLGYQTQEIHATKGSPVLVNMEVEKDKTTIDDVVVVGYGVQKKESVVGAISTIRASELTVPVRSLNNSIGGRVAGIISVQRSGEPGKDDATFWIRGISTFTGNRNPLVLVDGIERPMNNVDPLEIESFSILKDASATAVYGVRGANGVVLITTKRGFDGPAKIDVRYEQGFSYATKRPSYLDAYNRSMLFNEAIDANPSASQALK